MSQKLADQMAYPPRALRVDRAAAYLSISPDAFLRLVKEGLLPEPVKIGGITTWDRLELDSAYDALKGDDRENTIHRTLRSKEP
jgi:predicted DNA-binding transcriptional regulator AlpA